MKSLRIFGWLGTAVLSIALLTPFSALAQTTQRETPQEPSTQTPSTQNPQTPSAQSPPENQGPSASQGQEQTFMGKISKSKGDFVLKDKASNTAYKLDDTAQAKKFSGKTVKVTGTLDPATNMIHVTDIEMASASSY